MYSIYASRKNFDLQVYSVSMIRQSRFNPVLSGTRLVYLVCINMILMFFFFFWNLFGMRSWRFSTLRFSSLNLVATTSTVVVFTQNRKLYARQSDCYRFVRHRMVATRRRLLCSFRANSAGWRTRVGGNNARAHPPVFWRDFFSRNRNPVVTSPRAIRLDGDHCFREKNNNHRTVMASSCALM